MMPDPAWLVEALIGATLLMLLVLIVRKPVARLWGAHMAYALWALPALRMVLPAIPGWQPLYVPVAQAKPDGDMALALMPPADAKLYTQPLQPVTLQMGPDVSLLPDWPVLLLGVWAYLASLECRKLPDRLRPEPGFRQRFQQIPKKKWQARYQCPTPV